MTTGGLAVEKLPAVHIGFNTFVQVVNRFLWGQGHPQDAKVGPRPKKRRSKQKKEGSMRKKGLLCLPMKPCEQGVLLEMFLEAFFTDSLGDCRMDDLDVNCWKVSDHLGRSSRLVGTLATMAIVSPLTEVVPLPNGLLKTYKWQPHFLYKG